MATDAHPQVTAARQALGIETLARAPHRLLFFVGALNVLLATAWWLCWLVNARWQWVHVPQPPLFAGWLHATVMQYQLFPPFFFGFLLTVFPRWMGLKEFDRWHFVPVGVGLLGGQVATIAGAFSGLQVLVQIGMFMTAAGWLTGLVLLGGKLREARAATQGRHWHAWSCFVGMVFGFAGLLAAIVYLNLEDPRWMLASIKIGTYLMLVPVYFTVAHRMFPFFANNVVEGYSMWRPTWLIAVLWAAMLATCILKITGDGQMAWSVEWLFSAASAIALVRWWPRRKSPGLLRILFIALAWMPIAFALMGAQDLLALTHPAVAHLGRGPLHGLYIGCFGGLMVAMVTRVTQGHSGRLLEMPTVAWWAFALIQITAVIRLFTEIFRDPMAGFALAALLWIVGFLPWVVRAGCIYLQPRADGKPG